MKISSGLLFAPCGLAFLSFTSLAAGQETETLAPVVVTASRIEESVLDSANSVSELTSEDFTKNGSRTLPEALGELPGVMVQKTAHGHGSPYIRFLTFFRNLLLFDGIRFKNSIFR
jgi:hemoglobin/transferrin/lactoferrin receptor protein